MHGIHKATKLNKPRCSELAAYSNTQRPLNFPSVSCKHSLQPWLTPAILSWHVLFICYSKQTLVIPRESRLRLFPCISLSTIGHNYSRPPIARVASDGNEKSWKHEARNNLLLCLYRLWGTKKHIYLQCVMLGSLYRMLQLGSNYCIGSFISLSRAKEKSVGASHSYFRTCNLVICFIFGVSSKTQRKILQPYSRIFTCFVSFPTLQKFVLTLSKNLSVYTKTYEGNMHRVSAYDTYINKRNVKKHSHCVVSLTKGP